MEAFLFTYPRLLKTVCNCLIWQWAPKNRRCLLCAVMSAKLISGAPCMVRLFMLHHLRHRHSIAPFSIFAFFPGSHVAVFA